MSDPKKEEAGLIVLPPRTLACEACGKQWMYSLWPTGSFQTGMSKKYQSARQAAEGSIYTSGASWCSEECYVRKEQGQAGRDAEWWKALGFTCTTGDPKNITKHDETCPAYQMQQKLALELETAEERVRVLEAEAKHLRAINDALNDKTQLLFEQLEAAEKS